MVAIGGCDYCGEFCGQLGVVPPEWFEFNGWVPGSARQRHGELVWRRLQCSEWDGSEYGVTHVGPLHDRKGRKLTSCPNCSSRSQMDTGDWDTTLDHRACGLCWSRVGGGTALETWRQRHHAGALSPRRVETPGASSDVHHAVSTEPADRDRVVELLRTYAGSRLPPIAWVPSPVDVVRAATAAFETVADELDPWPRDLVAPWSIANQDVSGSPGSQPAHDDDDVDLDLEPESPSAGSVDGPQDPIERERVAIVLAVATAIRAKHPTALGKWPRLAELILGDAGQFAPVPSAGDPELRSLLAALRSLTGPLVILRGEIVASERPLTCSVDERGRLHAEAGPAMAYPDGLSVYAWRGVVVPDWLILEPERITPTLIDAERNVEVRRTMIERFGADRLIREGGATLVHEDAYGRLWHRRLPAGPRQTSGLVRPSPSIEEPIAMVEVQDATAGPDRERRTYYLRVPPTLTTARSAVAWTFGMTADQYAPERET